MSTSQDPAFPAGKSPTTAGSTAKRPLRLRVRNAAESTLRAGHPWVFADSIRDQNRPGDVGELAIIYDRNNRFLAFGLFDPHSSIRVRVLHVGKPQTLDQSFWTERLDRALGKRDGLFDSLTTGFRLVNGESDGWPGLVLDRYDTTVVLKSYTSAWLPWLPQITKVISSRLHPERIVLRLSRNSREFAATHFAVTDGQILKGTQVQHPVIFLENALLFEADVLRGQKTGFFLDQRENRRQVQALAKGRSVLNAFSFSGGFSAYAARGGARRVTDLDISPHALAAGERNFALNRSNPILKGCPRDQIQADAFEWLAANGSRAFDLVVLDPPSLAKRETERERAIAAYGRLAALGLSVLRPHGRLLACSCSAHVSETEFFDAVRAAARRATPRFAELARATHAPDHPATIAEARYLKAIYLEIP